MTAEVAGTPDQDKNESNRFWSSRPEQNKSILERLSRKARIALGVGAGAVALTLAGFVGAKAFGGNHSPDEARGPVVTSSAPNTPSETPSTETTSPSPEASPSLSEEEKLEIDVKKATEKAEALDALSIDEFNSNEMPQSARDFFIAYELYSLYAPADETKNYTDKFNQAFTDLPGTRLYDMNPAAVAHKENSAQEILDQDLFLEQTTKYRAQPGNKSALDKDYSLKMANALATSPTTDIYKDYSKLIKGNDKPTQIGQKPEGEESADNPKLITSRDRYISQGTLKEYVDETTGMPVKEIIYKTESETYVRTKILKEKTIAAYNANTGENEQVTVRWWATIDDAPAKITVEKQ